MSEDFSVLPGLLERLLSRHRSVEAQTGEHFQVSSASEHFSFCEIGLHWLLPFERDVEHGSIQVSGA